MQVLQVCFVGGMLAIYSVIGQRGNISEFWVLSFKTESKHCDDDIVPQDTWPWCLLRYE